MGGVTKSISKAFKSIVKVFTGVINSVIGFVGDIFGFVLAPFGAFDTPDVPNPEQEAQGAKVTKQGTNVAIPVIYGYRRTGGAVIFAETNGTSNQYLYIVYAICEGEIEGIKRVIVNDVDLPLPTNKYAFNSIISVTEGRFKDRIQMEFFSGTDNQSQSSLANQTPTWPTKPRQMPGLAYAVMRFEWKEIKTQEDADNNPFSGGIPKVQFDVLGKKVYDVRTHGGGLTLANDYANLTKSYSFNPANCLLDYMMNPRYGAGFKKEEINADSFKVAANKYEQTVNYSNSQSGRALTLNAVLDTRNKVLDNAKTLLGGCRGIMPFVQGRYKLKVEDGGNATDISSTTVTVAYDVDKDVIVGGISLTGEQKSTKYNQVIVNYIDPDLQFSSQQIIFNRSGDQVADEDEVLSGEFTFNTLTNKAIARDLGQMIYDKSRTQRQIKFKATQELLDVEVGDIIRVTDTVLDLNLKTFRVVGMKLNNDATIDIEAIEHDATLYPFTKGEQVEIPPSLYLPDEFTVIPYVRPLPQTPVGILPPNDPDNPGGDNDELPPTWDRPINGINTFLPTADYWNNGITYEFVTNHALGIDKSTGNIVTILRDYTRPYERGGPTIHIEHRINFPADRLINFIRITRHEHNHPDYEIGNPNIISDTYVNLYTSSQGFPVQVGFTAQPSTTYVVVKWLKLLNGDEFEYPDDSELPNSYTYYDYLNKKQVTGRNLTAYFNYIVQNAYTLLPSLGNGTGGIVINQRLG